jgi:hypothetical protein
MSGKASTMTGKASTTPFAGLEKDQGDLLWVLASTEDAVSGLVAAFGELTKDTDSILHLASAIIDCVEDESVSSVLPNVQALGAAAKQFVGDRLQATSGVLDTVTTETKLLSQLSQVTESQAKIALEIKILNVHTKIEVAHLGTVGAGFEYLARELADFSQSLAQSTDELTGHTHHHRVANEKTQSMLAVEIPNLREELARVEVNLNDDLEVMNSGLAKLSRTPVQFKQSAEGIAEQIAGVVVAVQGHDITRQQLEHVHEALAVISLKLPTVDDAIDWDDSDIACAHAGLAIQISQLEVIRATITEWTTQIRMCMGSILRISASELVGVGPLVLEQEQSMSSQLSHIDALERECQSYGEKLRSTLVGISNLSDLVTEHIQKSESARNRLRLLTFNSVVEASHLGTKADAICVIADGIAEVSVQWGKVSKQSESTLQEILSLSDRINEVMATFSESNSEGLRGAQCRTKTGLDHLRSAATFALLQGKKIEMVTGVMQARSKEIEKASKLFDTCFGRIDAVVRDLESIKFNLEADHPEVKQRYDEAEIERLFAASYTTETEREVLRAALSGTVFSAEKQCSTGNSVELF